MKVPIRYLLFLLVLLQSHDAISQNSPELILVDESELGYLLRLEDFFARDRIVWRQLDRNVLRGANLAFIDPQATQPRLSRRYEAGLLPKPTDPAILKDSCNARIRYASDSSEVKINVLGRSYRFFVQKAYHGEIWRSRRPDEPVPGTGYRVGQKVRIDGYYILDQKSFCYGGESPCSYVSKGWITKDIRSFFRPEIDSHYDFADSKEKFRVFSNAEGQVISLEYQSRFHEEPIWDTAGKWIGANIIVDGDSVCQIDMPTSRRLATTTHLPYPNELINWCRQQTDKNCIHFFRISSSVIYLGREEFSVSGHLRMADRYLFLHSNDDKAEYVGSLVVPINFAR